METTERKVSVLGTDYAIRFVAKNQDENAFFAAIVTLTSMRL